MKLFLQKNVILLILCTTTIWLKSEPIDSTVWSLIKGKKSPIEISYALSDDWQNPSFECGVGNVGDKWTFPLIAGMKLTAFKQELYSYCENIEPSNEGDLERGLKLFAAYGAGFNGNYDEHWSPRYSDSTVYLKVFKQLKNPLIQKAVWTFIEPALKHQVKSMELKFQGIIVLSFEYVSNYFKSYDVKKAREWYTKDSETREFAFKDYRGDIHPSRKISALVERLMFKWGILDYKTVSSWSTIIGNWLKKTLGANYAKSKAFWGK